MRTFKIKVYFLKDILIQPEIILVKNDYNSVEFDFEFDIEEGKKVFKLKKPDGNAWIKDIVDNKIVLVDYDEEGNVIPIINKVDEYNFEIVCYDENSKITATQKGKFNVRDEVVNIDEDELSENTKISLLDSLINETIEATNNSKEQAEYAKSQGDYAKEQANSVISANSQATEIINSFENNVNTYTSDFNKNADSKLKSYNQNDTTKTNSYNENASSKLKEYNDNHEEKITDYNTNATSKKNEYDTNHTNKLKAYNDNDTEKIEAYNSNHDSKLESYNTNDSKKTTAYNTNHDSKLSDYNTNTETKLTEYNSNHDSRMNTYNENHTTKMQEYNSNAEAKVNEFNEEVDTLKDELSDCYNNQLIGQASGTSIYVDDSADARLRAIEIDGALRQETTKGINLIDFSNPDYLSPDETIRYEFSNDAITISSLKDDFYGYAKWDITSLFKNNVGKTLFFYADNSTTEIANLPLIQLRINYNDTKPTTYHNLFRPGFFGSYAISNNIENIKDVSFNIYSNDISNLVSNSCTIVKPMLYFGATTDEVEYEKYTGGIASPSPEYPQEIEVLEAPNLLPYPYTETTKTVNGITFTDNDDGTITLNGTATNDANFKLYGANDINNQLPILGNYISGGINNNIKIKVINKDTNGYTVLSTSSGNKEEIDLSVYKNGYIEILVNKNTICDNVVVKPMLTKTNKINSYIPYGCIETKVANKNILVLNNDSISGSRNGIDYVWDKEKLILNGTATVNFDIYNFGKWGDTTKDSKRLLKKGTYTLSISGASHLGKFTTNAYFEKTRIFGLWKDAKKNTLTLDEDAYYSMFYINIVEGSSFNNETFYFQLEKGEDSTHFMPHQEDSITINLQGNFVAKINDEIKDTLRIENGHAILTKRIGKYVVDNSTTVHSTITSPVKDKTNFYTIELKNFKALSNYSVQIASNIFTGDTASKLWATDEVNYCSLNVNSAVQIRVDKSIDTTEKMKELLLEKGAYFYGVLAEPYNVDLGSIKLPKTFKGVSNIFLNANLETNFRVDYVKDTQLVISDLQSQINNINTLLSTTETSALLLDNLQSDLESEVI